MKTNARARKSAGDARASLEVVEVRGARRLVLVDASHPIWSDPGAAMDVEGAIVKICAPDDASDRQVAEAVERIRAMEPCSIAPVIRRRKIEVSAPRIERAGARAGDARRVVAEQLAELRHPDAAEIGKEIEAAMSAEGI